MSDEARPVLMTRVIAVELNVLDRWRVTNPAEIEGGMGVADVIEAEFLAAGASVVHWGEPNAAGIYDQVWAEKRAAA